MVRGALVSVRGELPAPIGGTRGVELQPTTFSRCWRDAWPAWALVWTIAAPCLAGGRARGVVRARERAVGVGGSVVYDPFQRGCARQHHVRGQQPDGLPGGGLGVYGSSEHGADLQRHQQLAQQQQLQHAVRQHGARHGRGWRRSTPPRPRCRCRRRQRCCSRVCTGERTRAAVPVLPPAPGCTAPATAPSCAANVVGLQLPGASDYTTVSGEQGQPG